MWGYGYRWAGYRTPKILRSTWHPGHDARGAEHRVPITDIRWKQWWLIHRKVAPALLQEVVWPASFSGIEISSLVNKDPRYFFAIHSLF